MQVVFSDWACRCSQQLGRLGITTGETYEMNRELFNRTIWNVLDFGMAVRIRPFVKAKNDGGFSVSVDDGQTYRPFSQIG